MVSEPDPDPEPWSRHVVGKTSILFTGLLLGFIPLFKQNLTESFGNTIKACSWIAFIRVAVTFVFVAFFVLLKDGNRQIKTALKVKWFHFLIYGTVCLLAVSFLYLVSLNFTTATISLIVLFTVSPITTCIIKAKDITRREGVCIAILVLTCVCTIVAQESLEEEVTRSHFIGMSCSALAGICYGFYSIVGKKLNKDPHNFPCSTVVFWQFAAATLSMLFVIILVEVLFPSHHPLTGEILHSLSNQKVLACILGIGFVTTLLPYVLYSFGLKRGAKEADASALATAELPSAAIISHFFLSQPLSPFGMMSIMVFIGASWVLIISIDKKNKR